MIDSLNYNASWMVIVFIIGYLLITFEHYTRINKATIALMMAIICWVLEFSNPQFTDEANQQIFSHHLSNIAQVVFFLLGAMTIVEIINVHQGFQFISNLIRITSKQKLLWTIGFITFFLSAVLDNLTTTVVMVTLLRKLIEDSEDRIIMGGAVVIAANAGGAWTPIGDVTTTMLWIGGQVSTLNIMKVLLAPSLVCLVASLSILSLFYLKGKIEEAPKSEDQVEPMGKFVFYAGIGSLIFVPIFRILTGLPPFMGMLFGLSAMWLITDLAHYKYNNRDHLRVPYVLSKVDLSGTLFFLGILLCVDALDSAKILERLAMYLDSAIGNVNIIATAIGLVSAVIDNVPLVAAAMGMYDLSQYPTDHPFWNLVAYCAGTGGSILLIGSAAGVVFMGMEKVNFIWYMKRISIPALVGYFAGIGIYLLM